MGATTWWNRIGWCCSPGTAWWPDGETTVATMGLKRACNVGPAVLLHDSQSCGFYIAKLAASTAAGGEWTACASSHWYGCLSGDPCTTGSWGDSETFSHLGQAAAY